MKIWGVFSMSIINRLKSLFKGENENEEAGINNDVLNTSDDVQATSSQIVNDDVVSGTKTTVPMEPTSKEPVVEGEKVIGIITQTDILRLIEKLES